MSDLSVTVLKTHNGRRLEDGDTYVLSYVASLSLRELLENKHVDSSEWYEHPVRGVKGHQQLLPGLSAALENASYGDTLRIIIPADLAFGMRGVPGRVPPSATLYFHVEIVTGEADHP